MKALVVILLSKLRASMWLVPGVLALAAVGGALALGALETRLVLPAPFDALLFTGDASGARAILAAIAGSMIGVTGVTFSITIVALTLASSQFGPRLLRNFMRDRGNQVVLGSFIGTFAFCLLGLRNVRGADEASSGAYLTVVIGVLLALISLALLIFFIHHIARSIQADTVIAHVAAELSQTLERLYPERVGHGADAADVAASPHEPDAPPRSIMSSRDGYLQAFETERILALARQHDVVIALDRRPGQFVARGVPVARAWPAERVDDAFESALRRLWIIGDQRTPEQDAEFLIEQLVETASRALSPGVNDPFTAIACIDRLGAALVDLSGRRIPSAFRLDDDGRLRIIAARSSFAGMTDAAFNQIRQYAADSMDVLLRLMETFEVLARATRHDTARRAVIAGHAEKTLRTARLGDHEQEDMRELEGRHARVVAALG